MKQTNNVILIKIYNNSILLILYYLILNFPANNFGRFKAESKVKADFKQILILFY